MDYDTYLDDLRNKLLCQPDDSNYQEAIHLAKGTLRHPNHLEFGDFKCLECGKFTRPGATRCPPCYDRDPREQELEKHYLSRAERVFLEEISQDLFTPVGYSQPEWAETFRCQKCQYLVACTNLINSEMRDFLTVKGYKYHQLICDDLVSGRISM